MQLGPTIVATWPFGRIACRAGWEVLSGGGRALDAAVEAASAVEDDPSVTTVGYGASPNAEGVVELDAAVMDGPSHDAGAVAGVVGVRAAARIARRVMERTPHAMLVGDNARRFALSEGFPDEDVLTDAARERYTSWLKSRSAPEGSDTIGVCALDLRGDLAVSCSTSGLAWKTPGRVGDSPIIGSGLYVDNEIGAAVATGNGDEIMKACLSYRAVISMGRGASPQAACEEAIAYLRRKRLGSLGSGAAVLVIDRSGCIGAAATREGFDPPGHAWVYAVASGSGEVRLIEGAYVG